MVKTDKTNEKKSLMDLAGKWGGSKEETDRMFREIYEDRKKFKLRDINFDLKPSKKRKV